MFLIQSTETNDGICGFGGVYEKDRALIRLAPCTSRVLHAVVFRMATFASFQHGQGHFLGLFDQQPIAETDGASLPLQAQKPRTA
ncbi:hypothetical protein G6L94_31875 [Agrobacterium rhizogenes]|uniref:hypothetical protein n=1 Tax=Rhizobium rhizogenes TaxID=359 RepID=UPI001146CB5F|nr:hypothetical protein [Rhizobium rhizogenes]NTI46239.1 hypothetical protein [Rhizobium rhizogenes]NTI52922.1 hypothetical protein [Rhizobium rhizogenes]NTI98295.1 hypothetical protein [Rhizobium rhizogenes]NTJ60724.1 hypothetical protein [Rhizobium rhizogenes]